MDKLLRGRVGRQLDDVLSERVSLHPRMQPLAPHSAQWQQTARRQNERGSHRHCQQPALRGSHAVAFATLLEAFRQPAERLSHCSRESSSTAGTLDHARQQRLLDRVQHSTLTPALLVSQRRKVAVLKQPQNSRTCNGRRKSAPILHAKALTSLSADRDESPSRAMTCVPRRLRRHT